MRFMFGIVVLFCVTLLSAFALAQPDPGADPSGFVATAFQALGSHDWLGMAAILLIGVVWVAREKLPLKTWVPWLGTRWGGTGLAFLLAAIGAAANMIFSTHRFDATVLLRGLYVGLAAIGGWEVLKDVKKGNK
mgnify:FL=1